MRQRLFLLMKSMLSEQNGKELIIVHYNGSIDDFYHVGMNRILVEKEKFNALC